MSELVDAVCAGATELAYAAAQEVVDSAAVGATLGVVGDGERFVSHLFECALPGYRGWYWAVSVTRAPDSDKVTVNDVVLLPGEAAITAPPWTPYKERIQPGDLSPGDVLPPNDNDVRLVPSWSAGDDDDNAADRAVAKELALGRPLVLSLEGRQLAADRWYDGDHGPNVALAQQAPDVCRTCGFMTRLAGPLGLMFGVCANAMANDDGRVVAFEHGCGAHSGARLGKSASPQKLGPHVFDTLAVETVDFS